MSDDKKEPQKEKPQDKARELESEELEKVSGGVPGRKPTPSVPYGL